MLHCSGPIRKDADCLQGIQRSNTTDLRGLHPRAFGDL